MSEPVKRYVVRGNTEDGKGPGFVGEVVLAYIHDAEVARLEQECERLSDELNNMRISWGLMLAAREAALKQVERLTAMLHRASKAESRPEFMQIIAAALSAKP